MVIEIEDNIGLVGVVTFPQWFKLVFSIKPSLCVSQEFYRTSLQYHLEQAVAEAEEVINSFRYDPSLEIKLVQVFDGNGKLVWTADQKEKREEKE